MNTSTMGLNARRLQDVEKFNAHAAAVEMLLYIRDVVTNPKTLTDLAKAKAEALKLTEEEEKKRQDAIELIARTDELKHSFNALDEREKVLDQKHKDNLNSIDGLKAEMKQTFDARDRAMKDAESKAAKALAAADTINKTAEDNAKRGSDEHRKAMDALGQKEDYLKSWENELSRRHGEVADREKNLFRK